jgi:aminopeptidase N
MRKIGLLISLIGLTLGVVQAQTPMRGADGLGDPYFPELGNGGYDARHYTLDLAVDIEDNTLSGTVTMDATASQDLSSLNLDFGGFDISEVTVNGVSAEYSRDDFELTIMLPGQIATGDSFTTSVTYSGIPREGLEIPGDVFARGWTNYGEGVYVASEPSGARLWFPVNDHPLDKATYSFRITVAKPYMVAANGLQQDKIDNGDTMTYVWEASDPMASYLVGINIADFAVQTEEGPNGILIRNYFPRDIASQAARTFSQTDEMIAYFSTIFGPYPFDAYGVAVADVQLPFALEIQTISLFGREIIQPGSWESAGGPQGVISHELAHQWFGDSVSLERWQDIWLNEGFATYASLLWAEHVAGRGAMDRAVRDIYGVLSTPSAFLARDLTPPGNPPADNLFNIGVYERGALVLHALRLEVGDDGFFAILQTYTDRYYHSNATTEEFIAVAEEVSGQELDSFFDSWLYDADMPPIPAMGLSAGD